MGKGWGTEVEPTLLGEGLLKVVEQKEESKEDSWAYSGWRLHLLPEKLPLSSINLSICRNERI